MKIRQTILLAVTGLCIGTVNVYTQNSDQPEKVLVESAINDQRVEELKKASKELFRSLQAKDLEKFAEFTVPEVVERLGGKKNYVIFLHKTDDNHDKVFEKQIFTAGDPHEIVAHSNKLFVVVPFIFEATTRNKTVFKATASMVGISTNDGKIWKFISDDAFFDFFPELKGKLSIPKKDISVINDKQ